MSKSKLEEALAQKLDFAARNENAPWPFPAPIRQFHPWWCCSHRKRAHDDGVDKRLGVPMCTGCNTEMMARPTEEWPDSIDIVMHEYRRESNHSVDFAWPSLRVIAECEGIRYGAEAGRHQRGSGFEADAAKYARLELDGWRVIRVTQRLITSGVALSLIEQALKERTATHAAP